MHPQAADCRLAEWGLAAEWRLARQASASGEAKSSRIGMLGLLLLTCWGQGVINLGSPLSWVR